MVKHYLVIRYINKIKMDVKIKSTTDFLDGFLFKADVHRWYVIYMPLESSLDIGVEIFNRKPVIGRRMALQCLSRRLIRVIPEMSPEPLCLNHTFISPVDKFYHINDSTKDWVADYISKIRQGHPKPWVTHCDIDRGGAK
ncbi:hypothetical protein [Vibrio ordalii]|uniref:hypothetical protein n=1 Tax=Vibrio ordalii TaxID=28174 RepID=UPI003F66AEAD